MTASGTNGYAVTRAERPKHPSQFSRKWIVSFAVLANFDVQTNKRNPVRRPCANTD
jgi:hypothetical protein